jgi:hypothetical protein
VQAGLVTYCYLLCFYSILAGIDPLAWLIDPSRLIRVSISQ